MSLIKPNQKYSYADYLTWEEDERWEIIDGVPYMNATPSRNFNGVIKANSRLFSR